MEMEKRLYVPADDIEVQDIESGESLRVRGACRKKENDTSQKRSSAEKLQRDDWIERKRNTLMIVASLIATMAFQAGLNPPSGVWQEDLQGIYNSSNNDFFFLTKLIQHFHESL